MDHTTSCSAAEFKDMETGAHISRMSLYAQKACTGDGYAGGFRGDDNLLPIFTVLVAAYARR